MFRDQKTFLRVFVVSAMSLANRPFFVLVCFHASVLQIQDSLMLAVHEAVWGLG